MALTADREFGCINPDDVIEGLAGAADTLYKGGIMSFGTNGLVKVAAATADEVPVGLAKKQVVAAGANAEKVPIQVGVLAVEKKAQHTTTVAPGTGGASNVNYDGTFFLIYDGTTGYYVWFDVADGSTDPGDEGEENEEFLADYTGVEVDVGTSDDAATVGAAIAAAILAIGGGAGGTVFGATGTTTVTIVAVNRGVNTASANGSGDYAAPVTLANTIYGTARQADVGVLQYAIADDGVVPAAQNGDANVALGLCIGLVGSNNELWIDTRKKALG